VFITSGIVPPQSCKTAKCDLGVPIPDSHLPHWDIMFLCIKAIFPSLGTVFSYVSAYGGDRKIYRKVENSIGHHGFVKITIVGSSIYN